MSERISDKILSQETANHAREVFRQAIDLGIDFKLGEDVRAQPLDGLTPDMLIDPLPQDGKDIADVFAEFEDRVLPYCYNFSSPNFMGFPDAGNSIGAISGNLVADFLQQNLINQSFCSPSGTYTEISVIRWLREVLGYENPVQVNDIFDSGGVITGGGTVSNTIGVLMARENHRPETMKDGVTMNDDYQLVVPKGIGHYSVKSAQMWIGCGNHLLEVETDDFRYDKRDLERVLRAHKGKVMGVVAYAGDSRTMTVEHFDEVHDIVKSADEDIWLHADACHGFSLGFSDRLRPKLSGIEKFDSITTDPQKVMNSPYTISALLVKDPQAMRLVSSTSDLIMQEQFAFGQITPFIGSKAWTSLKLWFAMKNLGRKGFGEIIEQRHDLAVKLGELVKVSPDFTLINEVDINAVGFMYTGDQQQRIDDLNKTNQALHEMILAEGKYHLHQFSIPDAGIFQKGEILYPLRFMSGNPNTKPEHLVELLDYIRGLAANISGAK